MAKKTKFKFNPTTLIYEKAHSSIKDKLLRILGYLLTSTVFTVVVLVLGYNFIDSPKERYLKRELRQMSLQYAIMDEKLENISKIVEEMQYRDDNIYRVIFEADPISSSIRQGGYGGYDKYAKLEGFTNSDIIIASTKKIDHVTRQLYVQSKSFDEVFELAKNKNKLLACVPAIQPISNKDLTRLASGFGYRIHPIYKTKRLHTGIDFSAPRGTPIYATGDGVVSRKRQPMSGYGITCVIDHGFGYQTLYAHMKKIIVRPGQKVKRGQVIGYVGNTGVSVGPHLHYEVIKNGKKINPIHFFFNDLTPEEYERMIEIASRVNQAMS